MRIALVANTDWYLYGYRKSLAEELRQKGHTVVLASPLGRYVERLEAAGFEWFCLPLERRGINPIVELAAISRLYHFYRTYAPDAVHHFTIKAVIYGSFAARLARVPRIVNSITGRGYLFVSTRWSAQLLRRLASLLYRLALAKTRVVFQNEEDQKYFLENVITTTTETALIRGSGIELEKYPYSKEPGGITTIILVARLIWEKGVSEFVAAAQELHQRGHHARFLLVGESDFDNPSAIPQAQLQSWVDSGAVEMVGWQDDIPAILRNSHIVCLPTFYGEGLPKILLEAAAVGRPAVTTNIPGCRDIVFDGENGFLVPPQDATALVTALEKLISDPVLRIQMGRAARRIVETRFSAELINRQTIALYQ